MGVPVFAACLTDQGIKDLQEQCSSNLKVLKLNVTDDEDIENAVKFVEKNLGPGENLWSVINNAGIITTLAPTEWYQKSDYEKTLSVNLLGSIMVATKFLPLLRKSRGRIINMGSIVSLIPMPNLAAYTVSKAGLDAFSDVLRRDMYSFGVSVHTILPTGFRTNICPNSVLDHTKDTYNTILSSEQKEFYKSTFEDLMKAYKLREILLDSDISKVTNKMTHALFSKFPKTKYWVGPGAVAVFWPLSLMPYWISDFIFRGGPSFSTFAVVLLVCFAKLLEHYVRSFWVEDIKSKHVLITGCDCGFGNHMARKLDKMGVSVFASCLTDQGMKDLQEQCSSNLKVLKLNVTNDEDIENAVKFVEKNIGPGESLWSIVNNAGLMTTIAPVEWHLKSDYEKTLRVNLLGSIMVTTKFLPLLRKSRGRVINMASIVCMIPMPNLAAYTVSKAGLDAFSDVLRRDMYSFGVSVHTIHPTGFRTNICPESVLEHTKEIYNTNLSYEQKTFYKSTLDDRKCSVPSRYYSFFLSG
ncbi:hypothetical protein FSP39_021131 [Pinctada imbricata]|uniref:Uncharacterized protein n=1 Tax=Pinctada imbricata TaxID=66713 RepID=A0AA88XP96_PINIB|nr:hypothetical protein FSP39_021131 [Pinctada imbricata]